MNLDKHKIFMIICGHSWSFVLFFSTLMPINDHESSMNYFRRVHVKEEIFPGEAQVF